MRSYHDAVGHYTIREPIPDRVDDRSDMIRALAHAAIAATHGIVVMLPTRKPDPVAPERGHPNDMWQQLRESGGTEGVGSQG